MRKQFFAIIFSAIVLCFPSSATTTSSIREAGDAIQLLLPWGATVVSIAKSDGTGLKQLAYTAALSTVIMGVVKPIVNEKRPDGGKYSFPSGHSSISFAASTYLWKRYGPKYGIPTTILAGFVGYSRVRAKRHYIHDVLAGAALGIATSLFFTTKYAENVSVTPQGVSLSFKF